MLFDIKFIYEVEAPQTKFVLIIECNKLLMFAF